MINPFRYRSYYYDAETGFYYLKSRYYDPGTGRFISQDDVSYINAEVINGLNLYAYCLNNPVMNVDPNGTFVIAGFLLSVLFAGLVAAGVSVVSQGITYGWDNINFYQVISDVGFAVLSVAFAATPINLACSVLLGGALGLAQYVINSNFHNEKLTWKGAAFATLSGLIAGGVSGAGALKTNGKIYSGFGMKKLEISQEIYEHLFANDINTIFNQSYKKILGMNIAIPFFSILLSKHNII